MSASFDPSVFQAPVNPNPSPAASSTAPRPSNNVSAAAFQRRRAEIEAVADADIDAINLEVRAVCMTLSEAMPRVEALRPAMAALPCIDQHLVAAAADYSEALWHIHSRLTAVAPETVELDAAYAEGQKLRETLVSDLRALARRRFIQPERIAKLDMNVGFKNVASDLSAIAEMFRDEWQRVEGKCAVTAADVERAAHLGDSIRALMGTRDAATPQRTEYTALRQRAYTLTLKAWDEVRRAVSFLRWHQGDANDIAPSLFSGRRGKGDSDRPAPKAEPAVESTTPGAAPTAPVTPPTPAASGGLPVGEPFTTP